MKKNFKIFFVIVSLLVLVLPITYSYAMGVNTEEIKKEKQFFEISKLEVSKSEKVEMTLNLDTIKYNDLIFELKSNEVIKDVKIIESENLTAEKNDNEIVMEINKEKTNVKTISVYYEIPESKKVGDTIKFVATITKIENETQTEETEKEEDVIIENTDKEEKNEEQTTQKQVETQTIEFEVKIIEEKIENGKQEEQKPNLDDNKQEEQRPNIENNKPQTTDSQSFDKNNMQAITNKKETIQNININYSNMQYSGMSSSGVQQVTYNGSDNNYLSELSIEGYSLNKDFSKENSTYFVTVGNEVETLKLSAVVEDDTADLCIYGNENLKSGTNKILISITAENGNVRNYRIYVTKNV